MAAAATTVQRSWGQKIVILVKGLFWFLLILLVIQQVFQSYWVEAKRSSILDDFQQSRNSRAIAMIHRQETVSLLGIPVSNYIDIEDSEAVLRAIRLTPEETPIDFILHTPGGLVLAAEQIAMALVEHKGKVTVFVPHYAMSGGTLLALAADEIVMDPNAVLGPVDPQIGDMPAASIVKVIELKRPDNVDDETLMLADIAQKSRIQVATFVAEVLLKHLPKEKAAALATALSEGQWTHDFPITVTMARKLGLPVKTDMPRAIYDLMDLYPQGGGGRPSVLYVPLHRERQNSTAPTGGNPAPKANRGLLTP